MTLQDAITIHTDGGCDPNPGPGGWAAILTYGRHRKELSGGFCQTTNNRMEIYAAVAGLRQVKRRLPVVLLSDSRYLVDAMAKGWASRWRARGWMRSVGQPALNADLWEELLTLTSSLSVRFEWVRGHAGVPDNERCDRLVAEARLRTPLPPDPGYARNRELMAAARLEATRVLGGARRRP